VQLFTDEPTVAGACAYASSYPPVGEYVSDSEIIFAGTPGYKITLAHTDGDVETIEAGSTLLLPCGYCISSFTDATGAPGIIKGIAPTGLSSNITMSCNSEFTAATLTASGGTAGSGAVYEWGTGNIVGKNSLGTTAGNTYAVSPSAPTTYWVRLRGTGACSATVSEGVTTAIWVYTEPEPVGNFETFADNASTYVTLTDARDGKVYPVVKIANRWIMARNLNYQEGLTWYANSAEPSTGSGSNKDLRSVFWCPGGNSSSTVTSNRAGCDAWGALYAWETAMMLDGKGSWTEAATVTYNTGAANVGGSLINQGRTASTGSTYEGRGICPPNWHVPTDNEWGIILDGMEDGTSVVHQNASSATGYGTKAGPRGKAACTTSSTVTSGGEYVNDETANWYYYNNDVKGTDAYGFRVLPSGLRSHDGSYFYNRGYLAYFWSSSAYNGSGAWGRRFNYNGASVDRNYYNRSYGLSVRCIKN
jgi:uncharacterized protein (TIGR02145 family)